ncbi:MAG TPA: hypothetical protein EYH02_01500 [Ignisphaera aggregans]|uniref:Uncharacterized protein n=1 Tax=Ignisphaera aggregans TaxID=334771 RepID=A0A832Z2I2_9CREN|nr:hypothetical protein [Ignisphaera aggregans]
MPIEGFIVEAPGMLWIVKGCYQPQHYVIALPRYSYVGSKIPYLDISLAIAADMGCITYDECLKRGVPAVARSYVSRVLDPRDRFVKRVLSDRAREFLELVSIEAGVDVDAIGVTGSFLAKTVISAIEPRDLDLIVYGRGVSDRLYHALRRLRLSGVTKPVSARYFKPGSISLDSWLRLSESRVFEGMYRDLHYSIRAVGCVDEEPCRSDIEVVERVELVVQVVEALSPYTMPYTYRVRVVDVLHDPREVVHKGMDLYMRSSRMRFSEIPTGLRLHVWTVLTLEDGRKVLDLDRPRTRVELVNTFARDVDLHGER